MTSLYSHFAGGLSNKKHKYTTHNYVDRIKGTNHMLRHTEIVFYFHIVVGGTLNKFFLLVSHLSLSQQMDETDEGWL